MVFDFTGYERIGRTAKVIEDLESSKEAEENCWNMSFGFQHDPEAIKRYHDELVEILAQKLKAKKATHYKL